MHRWTSPTTVLIDLALLPRAPQIPPPPDWSDWIHICGFFFLDNPNPDWKPDEKLSEFLADRSKKIVYIGFGSIVVDDPGMAPH